MKTPVILFLMALSLGATAQKITLDHGNITVEAQSISVKEAFALTDKLCSGKKKALDRYVIKDKKTYYRPGIAVFRKPHIYLVENGRLIRLRTVS